MRSSCASVAGMLPVMSRPRKQSGGQHKTERVSVGIPAPWHRVMRQLAAKRRRPVVWLLIELAMAEAEREGIENLPSAPWEDGSVSE